MGNGLDRPFPLKLGWIARLRFPPLLSAPFIICIPSFFEREPAPVAMRPVSERPVILCSAGGSEVQLAPPTAASSLTDPHAVCRSIPADVPRARMAIIEITSAAVVCLYPGGGEGRGEMKNR